MSQSLIPGILVYLQIHLRTIRLPQVKGFGNVTEASLQLHYDQEL